MRIGTYQVSADYEESGPRLEAVQDFHTLFAELNLASESSLQEQRTGGTSLSQLESG
jgi:hypothetical protein